MGNFGAGWQPCVTGGPSNFCAGGAVAASAAHWGLCSPASQVAKMASVAPPRRHLQHATQASLARAESSSSLTVVCAAALKVAITDAAPSIAASNLAFSRTRAVSSRARTQLPALPCCTLLVASARVSSTDSTRLFARTPATLPVSALCALRRSLWLNPSSVRMAQQAAQQPLGLSPNAGLQRVERRQSSFPT
eukprot:scaffold27535_cov103-Phaeocystis_antarctica.AAC.4